MNRSTQVLLLTSILALLLRLLLSPLSFHKDLIIQADWGKYISQTGASNFYQHKTWFLSWPNHPPLTSLHYGLCHKTYLLLSAKVQQTVNFLNKFDNPILKTGINLADKFDMLVSPEIPFQYGYLITLKLLPILGDFLIAFLIYKVAQKLSKKPYIFPIIYLFSPFSWYLSSLWGQTDQIAYVFTLLSFLLLPQKVFFSIIMFYFGIAVKPTSALFIPLYLYLFIKSKPKFIPILSSILICFFITYLTFKPFSPDSNIFNFTFYTLLPRLADRPSRLSTNSFNFWHIFILNRNLPGNTRYLLSGNLWGMIIFAYINLLAFKVAKKINTKTVLSALFLVAFGSWSFLTNMLDRYSFAGVVSCLFLTIYYPKLTIYWLLLSVCYWLNLFHGWWFPDSFYFLKNLMVFKKGILTSIPSLINTVAFIFIGRRLFRSS